MITKLNSKTPEPPAEAGSWYSVFLKNLLTTLILLAIAVYYLIAVALVHDMEKVLEFFKPYWLKICITSLFMLILHFAGIKTERKVEKIIESSYFFSWWACLVWIICAAGGGYALICFVDKCWEMASLNPYIAIWGAPCFNFYYLLAVIAILLFIRFVYSRRTMVVD